MQDLLTEVWHRIHPTIVFVTHDIPEAVYLDTTNTGIDEVVAEIVKIVSADQDGAA